MLLLSSPSTGCSNQRTIGWTFRYCDTCFRRSLHPFQSLRSGPSLSRLVLAEFPTVMDLHVRVCGLGLWPFSCFIGNGGSSPPPFPTSCFPLGLWALRDWSGVKVPLPHTILNGSQLNASGHLGMCLLFFVFPGHSSGLSPE